MGSSAVMYVPKVKPAKVIAPQPGFQTSVLGCTADIAIIGGAAGCGKSWCSVAEPLRYVGIPGFNAVIFRRTYPELVGGGSIWEESCGVYPYAGGTSREGLKDWNFPSGAKVEFRHLQREGDKYSHQGKEYALVIFEELTHFTEGQFWYLTGRLRSTCGVRPYLRATCNPDCDSFVAKLIEWWIGEDGYPIPERAGVHRYFIRVNDNMHWADTPEELKAEHGEQYEPKSLTFIPGTLEDNQILTAKDPGYSAWLESLPLVDRERLKGGNWQIKPAAGMYFQRSYFTVLEELPEHQFISGIAKVVRFWDKAATEATGKNDPSWTVGAKVARLADGRYAVLHVERFRGSPNTVDERMRAIATSDGPLVTQACFQDPGQAGKVDVAHTRRVLDGFTFKAYKVTKDKVSMAGPVSSQAEGGNMVVIRGNWNEAYFNELESFPEGRHDDQVDATSGAYQILQRNKIVML